MSRNGVTHEFVEFIPEELKEGVLYISISYATAVHACCCGCRARVVTPLTPTDWKLIFDGVSVSLKPSIGNWSFPCQSHYWISRNMVHWDRKWRQDEINSVRAEQAKEKQELKSAKAGNGVDSQKSNIAKKLLRKRIKGWFKRK